MGRSAISEELQIPTWGTQNTTRRRHVLFFLIRFCLLKYFSQVDGLYPILISRKSSWNDVSTPTNGSIAPQAFNHLQILLFRKLKTVMKSHLWPNVKNKWFPISCLESDLTTAAFYFNTLCGQPDCLEVCKANSNKRGV